MDATALRDLLPRRNRRKRPLPAIPGSFGARNQVEEVQWIKQRIPDNTQLKSLLYTHNVSLAKRHAKDDVIQDQIRWIKNNVPVRTLPKLKISNRTKITSLTDVFERMIQTRLLQAFTTWKQVVEQENHERALELFTKSKALIALQTIWERSWLENRNHAFNRWALDYKCTKIQEMEAAAAEIQCIYRRYRHRFTLFHERRSHAAKRIQAFLRQKHFHWHFRRFVYDGKRAHAAMTIQKKYRQFAFYRAYIKAQQLHVKNIAAIIIQRWLRTCIYRKQWLYRRAKEILLNDSALIIQRCYRAHIARILFHRARNYKYAQRIQRTWRLYRRLNHDRMQRAVDLLESIFTLAIKTNASIIIQAAIRQLQAKNELKVRRKAVYSAIVVQCAWRQCLARQIRTQLLQLYRFQQWISATLIQKKYRAYHERCLFRLAIDKSCVPLYLRAIRILNVLQQRHFRERYAKPIEHSASSSIAYAWRKHQRYVAYVEMQQKQATMILQRVWRSSRTVRLFKRHVKHCHRAATQIQRMVRSRFERERTKLFIARMQKVAEEALQDRRNQAARRIQASWANKQGRMAAYLKRQAELLRADLELKSIIAIQRFIRSRWSRHVTKQRMAGCLANLALLVHQRQEAAKKLQHFVRGRKATRLAKIMKAHHKLRRQSQARRLKRQGIIANYLKESAVIRTEEQSLLAKVTLNHAKVEAENELAAAQAAEAKRQRIEASKNQTRPEPRVYKKKKALPKEWIEAWDEAQGRKYFYNTVSAEERKEELPRELDLRDLLFIGIGSTVGSGIFATTGSIISGSAGTAAFISWIISGLSCIMSGFAFMEMSSLVPSSGSTYAYAYHVLGELPAVIAAWLLTLEYGMSASGIARSWATKVQQWIQENSIDPKAGEWLNETYYNLLGTVVMIASVMIVVVGIKFGKLFINGITATKVFVVIFIIVAGFTATNTQNFSPFIPPLIPANGSTPAKYGVQGVMHGASQAFFGYVGFDEVCCLAAEAKDPRRTMPRAVIGTVVATMLLSAFSSLALSAMLPYDANPLHGFTFAAGFQHVGYQWASTIVHLGEVCTMPVVVLISFLAQPRLMYAMAVDGLLPQFFCKVEPNGNLFWCSLLSGIFFTIVAFFIPFDYLWNLVSFGILVSYNMTNSAVILSRTRELSSTTVYKYTGCLAASSCIAMFLFEKGYVNGTSARNTYLLVSMIFLAITIGFSFLIYLRCPQNQAPVFAYRTPLVPFIPALSITLNWYLVAQFPWRDIGFGFLWILLAIVSYFSYGYRNSAGRSGWFAMLTYEYIDMSSMGSLRPSMILSDMSEDKIANLFRTKPIEVIEAEERKEELPRELGLRDLILIGIGGTVGTGVFATTGEIISGAAGAAAFLSWLIAGVSCILSGFAYMEMSSLIPSSGSTYAYSYHVLGELPAAIAAWLLTLEYGMSGAGVARSWATKVQQWVQEGLPENSTKADWMNEPNYSFLACLVMTMSMCILLVGIKFGKIFINAFTATKVVVVVFIIIVGFSQTNTANFSPFIPPLIPAADDTPAQFGVQGVMLGASQAFFGYVGFDEVCCLAAE
ncbi:Amino Acid-Polyamine-Organocation (APC) Family, partial [Thraustotheca clavata]